MRIRSISDDHRLQAMMEIHRQVSALQDVDETLIDIVQRVHEVLGLDHYVSASCRGLDAGRYRVMERTAIRAGGSAAEAVQRKTHWPDVEAVPVREGGFIGGLLADETVKVIDDLQVASDPVLGDELAGFRTALAIPVHHDGCVDEWLLLLWREAVELEPGDVRLAAQTCNLLSHAIMQQRLLEDVEHLNSQLRARIDELGTLQRSLLPDAFPQIPGLTFAAAYEPCDAAGGDYYDFREFDDGRLGIVVADVAGHGPTASVGMAMLRTMMRAWRRFGRPSESVVQDLNGMLNETLDYGMFVTAFFYVLDPKSGEGAYVNCGHIPARVRHADGSIDVLDELARPPLGVVPELLEHGRESRLQTGDTLLVFTDGLVEAFSPQREMFTVERVENVLRGSSAGPAAVIQDLTEQLNEHLAGSKNHDDMCVVAMRYDG